MGVTETPISARSAPVRAMIVTASGRGFCRAAATNISSAAGIRAFRLAAGAAAQAALCAAWVPGTPERTPKRCAAHGGWCCHAIASRTLTGC